jgi:hypothetical protein
VNAESLVARATQELAQGHLAAAVGTGWQAANQAILEGREPPIRGLLELADQLVQASDGRTRQDAVRLSLYCRAVLEGVGGGVSAPRAIDLLGSLGRKANDISYMQCPACAEDIRAEAKVCRYCSHHIGSGQL